MLNSILLKCSFSLLLLICCTATTYESKNPKKRRQKIENRRNTHSLVLYMTHLPSKYKIYVTFVNNGGKNDLGWDYIRAIILTGMHLRICLCINTFYVVYTIDVYSLLLFERETIHMPLTQRIRWFYFFSFRFCLWNRCYT